jgi:hypothetical protein
MSKHPLNLALRFILEVAAIVSYGIWGYGISDSWPRYLLLVLFPLLFALLWGVFAVQNDPSRSGKTVVKTPGFIRLLLELGLFAAAAWMLFDLGYSKPAWIFCVALLLHYVSSFDRVFWLLKQKIS